jgi:hypothetical protein
VPSGCWWPEAKEAYIRNADIFDCLRLRRVAGTGAASDRERAVFKRDLDATGARAAAEGAGVAPPRMSATSAGRRTTAVNATATSLHSLEFRVAARGTAESAHRHGFDDRPESGRALDASGQ